MKPLILNLKNFSQSLQTKNFKYGGYATLLFLLMVVFLIAINLVASELPFKFDLSENKLFSLSAQTTEILKDLQEKLVIYALYPTGRENRMLVTILKKYQEASKQVSLTLLDPNKNPGFIQKFSKNGQTPPEGSLIVTSGNRYQVIHGYDLFNYCTNQQTRRQEIESLAIEQRVTNAILYVATGKGASLIYQVQGHGEEPLSYNLEKQLENENYSLKSLTLLTQEIPSDAALLLVVSPKQDFTTEEAEKIRSFLANRGRAVFLIDYIHTKLPNLNSVLNSYGVTLEQQIIIEGDNQRHIGNPLMLLPQYSDHAIVKPLDSQRMPVLIPVAQSIKTLDLKKQSITVAPLLTTSEKAWAKANPASLNQEKSAADPHGPFNLAVAIIDQKKGTHSETEASKVVVIANAQFINGQYSAQVPGNVHFLTNILNWLQDQKTNLSIKPKSLVIARLNLNALQTLVYSGIVILVIPLGILFTGLMVWLRRRHL